MQRPPEFSDAKGLIETLLEQRSILESVTWQRGTGWTSLHPGKSATLRVGDQVLGVLGCLHPDAEVELDIEGEHWLFELDLGLLASLTSSAKRFSGLPRFPAVLRDFAVVVDADFASDQIPRYVREWNRDLVESVKIFDEYVGLPIAQGKKSLAYSVAYRAKDRTLTDEEVNELQSRLLLALETVFAVEQRK